MEYPEAEPLSRQCMGRIHTEWLFEREGFTNWPAYTLAGRSTMIYDLRRKAVDNSQQRELDLLAKFPGGRLLINWPIVSPLPVWLTVERGVRGK